MIHFHHPQITDNYSTFHVIKENFTLRILEVSQVEGIHLIQIAVSINDCREISHCYPEETFIIDRPSRTQKYETKFSNFPRRGLVEIYSS